MDAKSLIEELAKPLAHVFFGDGTWRKVEGKSMLFSLVHPANKPGWTCVGIGPDGTEDPPFYAVSKNGKPWQAGSGAGVKPLIFLSRETALAKRNYYANRQYAPVHTLDDGVLEMRPLAPYSTDDTGDAKVVDWPLAGFLVAADSYHSQRKYTERRVGKPTPWGATGLPWADDDKYPPEIVALPEAPTVRALQRAFTKFVKRVTKQYDPDRDEDFIYALGVQFENYGRHLEPKAFNRGFKVEDLSFEGPDNEKLMDRLAEVSRTTGSSAPRTLSRTWPEFKRITDKRRTGTDSFFYG